MYTMYNNHLVIRKTTRLASEVSEVRWLLPTNVKLTS
jgi:hypothetical protein